MSCATPNPSTLIVTPINRTMSVMLPTASQAGQVGTDDMENLRIRYAVPNACHVPGTFWQPHCLSGPFLILHVQAKARDR